MSHMLYIHVQELGNSKKSFGIIYMYIHVDILIGTQTHTCSQTQMGVWPGVVIRPLLCIETVSVHCRPHPYVTNHTHIVTFILSTLEFEEHLAFLQTMGGDSSYKQTVNKPQLIYY